MIDIEAISSAGDVFFSTSEEVEEEIFPWAKASPSSLFISTCALGTLAFFSKKRKSGSDILQAETSIEPVQDTPQPAFEKDLSKRQIVQMTPPCVKKFEAELSPCSFEDRAKIVKILSILDEYSIPSIYWKERELRQLESEIDHVHPLVFLRTVFSDPILKAKVKRVFNAFSKYFHQKGFLAGIEKGLGRYTIQELDPYLEGLSVLLHTKKDTISPLIAKKKWEALTWHFINTSSKK